MDSIPPPPVTSSAAAASASGMAPAPAPGVVLAPRPVPDLQRLDARIIFKIAEHADIRSACRMEYLNRAWHAVLRHNPQSEAHVWRRKCEAFSPARTVPVLRSGERYRDLCRVHDAWARIPRSFFRSNCVTATAVVLKNAAATPTPGMRCVRAFLSNGDECDGFRLLGHRVFFLDQRSLFAADLVVGAVVVPSGTDPSDASAGSAAGSALSTPTLSPTPVRALNGVADAMPASPPSPTTTTTTPGPALPRNGKPLKLTWAFGDAKLCNTQASDQVVLLTDHGAELQFWSARRLVLTHTLTATRLGAPVTAAALYQRLAAVHLANGTLAVWHVPVAERRAGSAWKLGAEAPSPHVMFQNADALPRAGAQTVCMNEHHVAYVSSSRGLHVRWLDDGALHGSVIVCDRAPARAAWPLRLALTRFHVAVLVGQLKGAILQVYDLRSLVLLYSMDVPVGHAYEVHGFGASRSEMELLLYTRNTTGAPDALLVLRLSSRQWERHTGVAGLTSAGTSPAASPGGSPAGSSGMLAAARSLLTGGSSTPAQNSSDPRLAGGPTVIVPAIETKTDYRGVQQSAAKVLVKALR